ncbi:hypothetical protein [Pseudomonas monteilii]|uniref:hypothetical protein n=1 Tax=Pseudomonas monteilii TaxID=76759 RepID=UPI00138E3930|nr:hypothetical protein [Pseudomonas monteilii]MDH0021382.1 hypothetical protein [Pseudomonas monteilii]
MVIIFKFGIEADVIANLGGDEKHFRPRDTLSDRPISLTPRKSWPLAAAEGTQDNPLHEFISPPEKSGPARY